MNCQEFRENWIIGTDDATLSHIENCNDCLLWIEANSLSDEEVMYLKEFPQPSPQLEDKIMQAIYASSGKGGLPPHSAAEHLITQQKSSLPKARRLFSSFTAWGSAAAALLVVGLLSYQEFSRQDESKLALSQGTASVTQNNQVTALANTPSSKASENNSIRSVQPVQPVQQEPAKKENPATAPASEGSSQPATKQSPPTMDTAIAMSPRSTTPIKPEVSSRKGPLLPPQGAAHETAMNGFAMNNTTMNDATMDHALVAKRPETPTTVEEKVPMSAVAKDAAKGNMDTTANTSTPAPDQQQQGEEVTPPAPKTVYSLAAASANQKDITISTFTDIPTAVQASDMPIPAFERLPEGFSLISLSLQYESQTSKHVIGTTAVYGNGSDQISVEVKPVEENKQLSIPGVFANRQLFSVNGNQAIGVTYQLPPSSPANEHAVHFINDSNNQHLYVILSAHSGTLDRLIEMAKSTKWKK
ncbi:hypothetical protein ACQCN2_07415 [Brevibacillus ginsengisoli]|uniref:hypothetical protein n=1 Tax=Brevibacillus ginsengisoli TaxID=363854 RepID=UPI003CE91661